MGQKVAAVGGGSGFFFNPDPPKESERNYPRARRLEWKDSNDSAEKQEKVARSGCCFNII